MFFLLSAGTGLLGCLLLSLHPAFASEWCPQVIVAAAIAAVASARLLRGLILRRDLPSWIAAAVLHAFVSVALFSFLRVGFDEVVSGDVSLARAVGDAWAGMLFGAYVSAATGHVTLPLGLASVWVLRRCCGKDSQDVGHA